MIFTHLRCFLKKKRLQCKQLKGPVWPECAVEACDLCCRIVFIDVKITRLMATMGLWDAVVFIYISYYNTVEACLFILFFFLALGIHGGDSISIPLLPADISLSIVVINVHQEISKPHESGTNPNDQIWCVVAVTVLNRINQRGDNQRWPRRKIKFRLIESVGQE